MIIKFNYLMLVFNLLPIFPLDGYRVVYDLFDLNRNYLFEEILIYISILLLFLLFISLFILKIYGIMVICIYLFYLNSLEFLQIKRKKLINFYNLKYEISRLRLK